MIRHQPEETKEYECKICQKRFHIEYDVKIHNRHVHERHEEDEKAFCVECNKKYDYFSWEPKIPSNFKNVLDLLQKFPSISITVAST